MSRGEYPATRMRRNRMKAFSRRLVAENSISIDDLIWPLFVIEGTDSTEAVASMPDVNRWSINHLVELLGGDKVFIPKRPGEPDSTFADISSLQNDFGYNPTTAVETGVNNFIEWFTEYYKLEL